jgi:hypothetical protein
MRIYRFSVIIALVLVISVIICGSLSSAKAGDYLGEYCWSVSKTENEQGPDPEGPFIMRAGVTYVGGGYYTLQGIIQTPEPDPFIFGGTATVVGSKIYITINGSQDHSTNNWRDSGVMKIQLDSSTLGGTWWTNYMTFNTVTHVAEINYSAGTTTFTACP